MANTPPVAGGALGVTTSAAEVPHSVPPAPDNDEQPRCRLCPLALCHHDCHGIVDQPRRIRMTRRMPWRHLAPDAVIVDRRSRWGNPYTVAEHGRARAVALFRWELYSTPGRLDQARRDLAGRDLACWCPLDAECHADVLLEAVNGGGGRG